MSALKVYHVMCRCISFVRQLQRRLATHGLSKSGHLHRLLRSSNLVEGIAYCENGCEFWRFAGTVQILLELRTLRRSIHARESHIAGLWEAIRREGDAEGVLKTSLPNNARPHPECDSQFCRRNAQTYQTGQSVLKARKHDCQ